MSTVDAQVIPDDAGESKADKRKPHETDPWYKRYARDFFEDTRDLSPEQRGLYNDVIDLIYMAEGPIKDDDRLLAFRMCVDVRKWRRIRKALLATGKLFITRGQLHNKRARAVLAQREIERRSMGRRGVAPSDVDPDLFENINPINGTSRPRYPSSDQSESERDDRSFEPRVIDGGKSRPATLPRYVSEAALDQVRKIAPTWDRQALLKQFMDWKGSKNAIDMDKAFLGWVRKFTKGKAA